MGEISPSRLACLVRSSRQLKLTKHLSSTYIDGMNEGVSLAEAASGADPASGLRAAKELRELAERLEALQVRNARGHGWSWAEIAVFLGVSKQAVHKKYAIQRLPGQRHHEQRHHEQRQQRHDEQLHDEQLDQDQAQGTDPQEG